MIKLTFVLRRLPALSREDFQSYWLERHGPLVRALAPRLGIRRYVQLHTMEADVNELLRASRGGPEPCDGVAELWFDDARALEAAASTAEGREAALTLLEDERRFIDLARSPLFVGTEHAIIPG